MSVNVFSNQILLDVWNPKYTELYSLLTQNIAKTAELYETQLIDWLIVSINVQVYYIRHASQLYPNISSAALKGPSKTATWVPARQSR